MATLEELGLIYPTDAFPWPTAPLDISLLNRYLQRCIYRGIYYGLGDKADADGRSLAEDPPLYHSIDCSGWVRAAVAVATSGKVILPDGSFVQNAWCRTEGLKRSCYAATALIDGVTRICFIRPNAIHKIGHVYLARDGRTLESYGGNGPGSRSVGTHILSALTTDVYVLSRCY